MRKHPSLRTFGRNHALAFILAGSIAMLFASPSAQAASGTWLNTGAANGLWSTTSNWQFGTVPGATSGTTNTDIALFNTAVGTFGTAANPILIDANRNIRTINFDTAAGSYVIGTTGGNPLVLSSAGGIRILNTLTATNAIETINAPIVLTGTIPVGGDFTNNSASGSGAGAGTMVFSGGITATGGGTSLLLQGANTNANTINGTIANGTATSLGITKNGTGTWVLNGSNTFSGSVQINSGTLSIASIANSGVASPLGTASQVALGGTGTINAKLQFTGASGGSSNRTINLFPGGNTGGGIIENTVAGQTLTLSGGVICNSIPVVNVGLELTGAGDGILSGTISNTVGRVSTTKSSGGTWTFSGTNSYSGDTTINGGTLKIGNARALGFGGTQTSSTGVTTVHSGATLDLNGITAINEPIVLNGTGIGGNGALVNNSATAASIGTGVAGVAVAATGSGSGLSSAPSVVISGTGTGATATASLGITTASIVSATGGTGWVTGDTVNVFGGGGSGAIGTVTASGGAITSITITSAGRGFTSAPTTINKLNSAAGNGGTITGNATNFTVGGLTVTNAGTGYTGTPTVTIGGSAAAVTTTLSSVNVATDSSIGGSGDITINSVVSGAGLTKVGAGTLTLSGMNTYTGNTTVHAGTLKLDGSISSSATIIVGDAGSSGTHLDVTTKTGGLTLDLGQTLKGIGQIDGNTVVLGTHAPGNSPGLQTFNGNLIYSTGSMLNWELATNAVGTRGTDFDGINVIGTGVLSIATGVTSNLVFNTAGSTVDWNNVFWNSNHRWSVYNDANIPTFSSGSIFDTINVSTDSLGAMLSGGTFAWSAAGNEVFLNFTVTSVPEPMSFGTLTALGLLGVGTLRRRRHAKV